MTERVKTENIFNFYLYKGNFTDEKGQLWLTLWTYTAVIAINQSLLGNAHSGKERACSNGYLLFPTIF